MKTLFKIVSILCLMNQLTFAADKGGNGGDAIVCEDRTFLLDGHEAQRRGYELNLPGKDLRERVLVSIKRLQKVDEIKAQKIQTYALEMVTDFEKSTDEELVNIALTDDTLTDIDDSKEISIPKGCHKEQLVIQQQNPLPGEKKYVFNTALWESLDQENKALTILHEAWYRLVLEHGAIDSRFARFLNGLMASSKSENITITEYASILVAGTKYGVKLNFQMKIDEQTRELVTVSSASEYYTRYNFNPGYSIWSVRGFDAFKIQDITSYVNYLVYDKVTQEMKYVGRFIIPTVFGNGKIHAKNGKIVFGSLWNHDFKADLALTSFEIGDVEKSDTRSIDTVIKDGIIYRDVKSVTLNREGYITNIKK